jgi:hypothetical protein
MEPEEPLWNMPPWLGTFFLSEYYFELKGKHLLIQPFSSTRARPSAVSSIRPTSRLNCFESSFLMAAGSNWLMRIENLAC